jgi:hypothetical protein
VNSAAPRALLRARLSALAAASPNRRSFGYARPLAYLCALALLVASGVSVYRGSTYRDRAPAFNASAEMLPNPVFTPGSTREVSLNELCSTDRDEVVVSVPGSVQERVFQEYGVAQDRAPEYEVDYLITPGLGGSDDVRNLWPEPHRDTAWNSYVKDQLEDHLHRMVCGRKISLSEAQKEIAGDWIAAYKKYFHTERPLAGPEPGDTSRARTEGTQVAAFLPSGSLR